MPLYASMTIPPEKMARGYGSLMEFVDDAAFWVFNQVSNFAYTRYNIIHPEIHALQQAMEKQFIAYTPVIDEAALKLYGQDEDMAVSFLTNYSVQQGNNTVMEWKKFYQYLFTRFMDGNVKEPDPGQQNPKLDQPGYGEDWYRKIVEKTGDQFKVTGAAH
jgi:dipeptidase